MTAAHTPGPWVVREGANSHCFDGRLSPEADENATIAFVDLDTPDVRLIASAPDLLEALKRIAAAEADHLDGTRDSMVLERAIKVAKSALQKATGQ